MVICILRSKIHKYPRFFKVEARSSWRTYFLFHRRKKDFKSNQRNIERKKQKENKKIYDGNNGRKKGLDFKGSGAWMMDQNYKDQINSSYRLISDHT